MKVFADPWPSVSRRLLACFHAVADSPGAPPLVAGTRRVEHRAPESKVRLRTPDPPATRQALSQLTDANEGADALDRAVSKLH
jgi:hypothetical protein